jgi:hypothetical protein
MFSYLLRFQIVHWNNSSRQVLPKSGFIKVEGDVSTLQLYNRLSMNFNVTDQLSDTGEIVGVQWDSTSAIHRRQENLWFS